VTVTSLYGPAAAVTWGSRVVVASSAGVARNESTATVTSAPCCAANARLNGRGGSDLNDDHPDAPPMYVIMAKYYACKTGRIWWLSSDPCGGVREVKAKAVVSSA
jgi:hypothetical protein